uniref:NACHT LRR and PYD domain-containing protein n=1 Tax=Amphiprion percula TaxID=161767 RepID=A0A3P8RWU7_AMPPE
MLEINIQCPLSYHVLSNMRHLRLWHCGLADSHCEVVASALKSNSSLLTELDLSDNQLQDPGNKCPASLI